MIRIYNTLNNKIEDFIPKNSTIKIYVCGPTVYNFIHIGNARPYIFFDVVRNYLKYLNYEVIYVQNFTDIDDKIIKIAKDNKESFKSVSDKYIKEYFEDIKNLNIKRADIHPRVSDHIYEIINIISELLQKGIAYKEDNGIYFNVIKFEEYGKLSKQFLNSLEKEEKKNFALWKFEKDEDISWEAPFGRGRPGWHIECSAMISKNLGEEIDIHGGGQDLIFPHHENEIAQSECLSKRPLARYWMHNAFVIFENNKMSKSLGNFILIRELTEKCSGNVIRLYLLMTHYRKPVNFSFENLKIFENSYKRLENFLLKIENMEENEEKFEIKEIENGLVNNFEKEMNEDFNTPGALGVIFKTIKSVNIVLNKQKISTNSLYSLRKRIIIFLEILGINIINKNEEKDLASSLIKLFIKIREEARNDKNWQLSDKIREELLKLNITLEDKKEGTDWKIY